MTRNIILAGVGGQGILSIAYCICKAAVGRNLNIKQSEVHGMSQRGGNVESHVRYGDALLYSEIIPKGLADMVIGGEPLETLRHQHYLRPMSTVISSVSPIVNFEGYPNPESLLERIAGFEDHVLLDSKSLARVAGHPLVESMVLLGAASDRLGFRLAEFDTVIEEFFGPKGARVVQANQRALRVGRVAAELYRESMAKGHTPQQSLEDLNHLPADTLTRPRFSQSAP